MNTNLISNAVKYLPAGSTIQMSGVTADNLAALSVQDEGMGIAPDDMENLSTGSTG